MADRLLALQGPINALVLVLLLLAAAAQLARGVAEDLTRAQAAATPTEQATAPTRPAPAESPERRLPTPALAPTDGPLGPSARLGYGL